MGLMRGDRIVDLAIDGIKYGYDKRIIIMAIATPNALTDNRIRYVTNTEGKTIDVIVPVELWQQIINSINIDSNLSQQEDNLESFALQNLEQCYGEDEPEYSLDLIKEHNSNYARK
ncbi:MAG: hypothetical protein IM597_02130 [Pseudanabaena sp. M176S2SP2A07QC]|nr:hypothetical protein [Pseudanabaena sp. M176S2SP2A07QC]MCA6547686.1 hypothetical protein [Pseudanabaena sp. M152S2SP2A07QC]MCA6571623.1 hypothetical protein [Pseudanabaena sp. M065S1SP2A07QC]MCA6580343.1 hypothetical protein [Pseudanabaena sp. M085S1SP2A07QC]